MARRATTPQVRTLCKAPTAKTEPTWTRGAIARDITATASWVTLDHQVDDNHWMAIPSHRNDLWSYSTDSLKLIPTPTLEDEFYHIWRHQDGPQLQRQVPLKRLVPSVSSRHVVDFFLPEQSLVVEVNGGTVAPKLRRSKTYYVKVSGHNSPEGIRKDYAKQNILGLNGFTVLELDTNQATEIGVIETILLSLKARDEVLDWGIMF